jgi:alanine dehydrogenase
MMRTGAASGLATHWHESTSADVMALFGTGWQPIGPIASLRKLLEVRVVGRDEERRRFAQQMAEECGVPVIPSEDKINPGTHVNAVDPTH